MAKKSTKQATPEVVQSTGLAIAATNPTNMSTVFTGNMNLTEKDVIDASVHTAEKAIRAKIKLHQEEILAATAIQTKLQEELHATVSTWSKREAEMLSEVALPLYRHAGYSKVNVEIGFAARIPENIHDQSPEYITYKLYGSSQEENRYGSKTITYQHEMSIRKHYLTSDVLGSRLPELKAEYEAATKQRQAAAEAMSLRRLQLSTLDQVARQAKSNFVWATLGSTPEGTDIMHRTQAGILSELDLI